jgi:hypothetical protein
MFANFGKNASKAKISLPELSFLTFLFNNAHHMFYNFAGGTAKMTSDILAPFGNGIVCDYIVGETGLCSDQELYDSIFAGVNWNGHKLLLPHFTGTYDSLKKYAFRGSAEHLGYKKV